MRDEYARGLYFPLAIYSVEVSEFRNGWEDTESSFLDEAVKRVITFDIDKPNVHFFREVRTQSVAFSIRVDIAETHLLDVRISRARNVSIGTDENALGPSPIEGIVRIGLRPYIFAGNGKREIKCGLNEYARQKTIIIRDCHEFERPFREDLHFALFGTYIYDDTIESARKALLSAKKEYMPTLNWIGKDAVVNHDKEVPFRLLKKVKSASVGNSQNLIVHGDNLEALKALMPYYAGKVKCVYIDPPYNTGNEGWVYNDKVNSPKIRQWLGKVVGHESEDLCRHDKWLCMMYPRLLLLKQLMSTDGIIAISIDDNELNNLGLLLDDIFGQKNRLACAPWLAEPSGGKEKTGLRGGHEYVFIYHNGNDENISRETRSSGALNLSDKKGKYRKGRELMKWGGVSLRKDRPGQWFALQAPDGSEVWPIKNDGEDGHWRWGKLQKMKPALEDFDYLHWEKRPFDEGVSWGGQTERWVPYEKIREINKSTGWSTWLDSYGFNADATRELKELFGKKPFDTPKPMSLIRWIVSLHADEDAIVLDSFAGSGTVGHAVLDLNKDDGGNRKFILVEMDDNVARNITTERVKRAIEKYDYQDGFEYCELGKPLFDEHGQIENTCDFNQFATYIYFTETQMNIDPAKVDGNFIGDFAEKEYYLIYKEKGQNELGKYFLKKLRKGSQTKVIYADQCLLDDAVLSEHNIIFKQIPYEVKVY